MVNEIQDLKNIPVVQTTKFSLNINLLDKTEMQNQTTFHENVDAMKQLFVEKLEKYVVPIFGHISFKNNIVGKYISVIVSPPNPKNPTLEIKLFDKVYTVSIKGPYIHNKIIELFLEQNAISTNYQNDKIEFSFKTFNVLANFIQPKNIDFIVSCFFEGIIFKSSQMNENSKYFFILTDEENMQEPPAYNSTVSYLIEI
jgi:hypothetical protein